MKRKASAIWQGDLKKGKGSISTESGALQDKGYSFGTRFESAQGTNPEELVAAAHAACFSMALSMILSQEGVTPDEIKTTASVSLNKEDNGFAITAVHLEVAVKAAVDNEKFQQLANQAKENCPVSKVLNADITMDASLIGTSGQ